MHIHDLLIPHQTTKEKSSLASLLVSPHDILRMLGFFIPSTQQKSKAVVKQASLSCRICFVALCRAFALFVIIDGHPPNWNPVFRLLTLVLVKVEDTHCYNHKVNLKIVFRANRLGTGCTYCIWDGGFCACQKTICQHKTGAVKASCSYRNGMPFEKPSRSSLCRRRACQDASLSLAAHI